MSKRTIAIAAAALIGIVTVPILIYIGGWYVERQRVRDAEPAFLPLVPLGVSVLCNPVAFHRHCNYIAEFPPTSELCDDNANALVSLNSLPQGNRLDLFIETPRITDRSLPYLKAIRKIDALDVTKSSISDEGIAELRAAFPNATVVERKSIGRT